MKAIRSASIALILGAIGLNANSQILLGQTAGFTGTVASGVREATDGALLYFSHVNSKGGVGGQKIELISMDDRFDPKLASENARVLIEEKKVAALFLTRGTPHTEAVLPHLDKHGVPLVGPSTGAMVLHQPVQKYVFNTRSSYQREAEKAVAHLATIGVTRIAAIYADDSFGADALTGAQNGMDAAQLKFVGTHKFQRAKPDFSKIAPAVVSSQAQAVLLLASGSAVVDGIKSLKSAGSKAQFVTLSNNASAGFIASLGDDKTGVIVTQVFPKSLEYGVIKELNDLARAKGLSEVSPAHTEGFVAAKVMVEALKRSGPKPTSEKIQSALENMNKFDLGGIEIGFTSTDHTGLNFADLSIINRNGKFMR